MVTVAQEAQARRDTFKSVCNFLMEATAPSKYSGHLTDCLDLQMEVAAQLQGKDWLKFKLIPETGNCHFIEGPQSEEASQKALNAVVIRFLKWVERAPKLKTVAQEARACRDTFQSIRTFLVGATSFYDPSYDGIPKFERMKRVIPDSLAEILDLQMKVAAQLRGKDWRSFRPLSSEPGDILKPIPNNVEEKARYFLSGPENPDTERAQYGFNSLTAQFLKWVES